MIKDPVNDEGQLPADNRLALRRVVRAGRKAALGTLMGGAPYCSLVTVAVDPMLAPLLLLSGLSDHTRNILADSRVSLLFDGTDGLANPQTGPRVTLIGRAQPSADPQDRARFLALHPGAALYAGFADFGLWRVVPERVHFVGGFGRAVWFDAPFGLDPDQATAVAGCEAPTLADGWQVVGTDIDGADLRRGESFVRLAFERPVATREQALQATLAGWERLPR
ncbi:Heme iron utilization protein [Magnetospirillum sp. LM-5]|uniref:HugZ family pyridoxamine 5'-phosphate oxidase n=1 Tax=Magnetospirillum sp. LM-5 TaxID=2681466 RepID=UPI00137CCABC|nr:pyridoxamine 5'-phosphate oxidase family protein [Magnetospirillum sp. LM-5]CAA7625396.1 Heme iron utilization protein [Magnetospirillum sp. LM-5]